MISFSHLLDAAAGWVWQTSLQASVLIVLVWLLQWAFGKMLTPRWRYALGVLVLLRLVMPAVPASSFSAFNFGKSFRPTPSIAPKVEATVPPITLTAIPAMVTPPRIVSESETRVEWGTLFQTGAEVGWLVGFFGVLGMAGQRHRQLSRNLKLESAVTDQLVLARLEEAAAIVGLRRPSMAVATPVVAVPAVFGFRRPRLLLPPGLSEQLTDDELRLVFLHELTHVRRGDVALNWIAIGIRAVHWFNPLVWLAVRRLRADQELVCDATVLARLAPSERRRYGDTLIKLLNGFTESRLCPSLVPVITHKHEIKRRIIMIAQFKPTGRIALAVSALLLIALCGFTFTRAAESTKEKEVPEAAPSAPAELQRTAKRSTEDRESLAKRRIEMLKEQLKEAGRRVEEQEQKLNVMRTQLRIPDAMADADAAPPTLSPETVQRLDADRGAAQSNLAKYEALLAKLKSMARVELRKSIATAYPGESELVELFNRRNATEQELTRLLTNNTLASPDVHGEAAVLKEINRQIDDKIDGVLAGLDAVVESTRAQVDALTKHVREARQNDAELAAKYRPYYEAKHRLAFEQKMYEVLTLKLTQEVVDLPLQPDRRN
jgi:bla regulator protein BlaR1